MFSEFTPTSLKRNNAEMSRSDRPSRDRICSSRLSRLLARASGRLLSTHAIYFHRVSEAAPSSRCRRSSFSKHHGSSSGDPSIARIHLPPPPPPPFLSPPAPPCSLVSSRFFPGFFYSPLFFTPSRRPPTRRAPSRSFSSFLSLAFLRVVRAYEFDFTRFPSIERRKLFLEQPISLCLLHRASSTSSFFLVPLLLSCTARPFSFFFVSLADSLNAALKKRQLTRRGMRGHIHFVDR